ncbi:hypothetical protein ACKWTF_009312 [Chironomus riparius]
MKSSGLLNLIVFINFCTYDILAKDSYSKDTAAGDLKNEKLRMCIVESRGSFRRTEQHCPIIENQTNIECIVGIDRLDCARRISKGYAHFGVFSSEDLVSARWATFQILVTNELRFHAEEFEYDVVVVVDNEANINSAADLRSARLCHPGKGINDNWNDIISDYLESTMVARECEEDLTLAESRIKASANFFGPSCKAGPWVNDALQDSILKSKYPSLCSLCYDKSKCGIGDKHWGRRGALECLIGGSGQAAYVRLDDVKSFFNGKNAEADPNNYSFLCPDGHLQPLTSENPCTWISKPWPVIAAKRSHAEQVQEIFRKIDTTLQWQQSMLLLLESYYINVTSLDVPIPIDDYLDKSTGYQSAHSFPACYPPRHIVYCTTSIIEFVKCSWLQEVSTVYGIEPNLQCIRGESLYRCLDDVNKNIADVVMVDQDERADSERKFNLIPLLSEFSFNFGNNYVTVAVVKENSPIKNFEDLKWKRACFPSYEGAAFYSVMENLQEFQYINNNCSNGVIDFFASESCFGSRNCKKEYSGDEGALKCLDQMGDVAFVNLELVRNLTGPNQKYRVICGANFKRTEIYHKSSDICYLSWTSKGTLLTSKTKDELRKNEFINTLKSMDYNFGKHKFRSGNIPFTMFGPFDKKENVLFKDATDGFRTPKEIKNYVKFDKNLEKFYSKLQSDDLKYCSHASSLFKFNYTLAFLMFIIFKFL